MCKLIRRRIVIGPAFVVALGWTYFAIADAQHSVAPVSPVLTEEAQQVVFDRGTFQSRELSKKLPLQDAWPTGREMEGALERFGLSQVNLARAIPVPARVTSDVYLVGQDRVSNLTYLIDCGREGIAIIDPTYESEFERTIANVEACGWSRKDIRWVLNTHCHVDHAMADKKFRELGAELLIHEADASAVEKGTQVTAFYLAAKRTTLSDFPRCKVDRRLSDGEELQLGNKTLLVIHTPGHTPGSASFLLRSDARNLLFAGDTVLYDYRLGWQGNPYADNHQYLSSLKKLESFTLNGQKVQWDILLPGHGTIATDKAYLDVAKARELVAADLAAGREVLATPFGTVDYRIRMFGRPGDHPGTLTFALNSRIAYTWIMHTVSVSSAGPLG
jgi:glyoxylase-like metal-dependent hydrolase (beta-lactamase superfamily II)